MSHELHTARHMLFADEGSGGTQYRHCANRGCHREVWPDDTEPTEDEACPSGEDGQPLGSTT